MPSSLGGEDLKAQDAMENTGGCRKRAQLAILKHVDETQLNIGLIKRGACANEQPLDLFS